MTAFIVQAREEAKRRGQANKLPHGNLSVFALGAQWAAEQAWDECAQWHAEEGMGVHEARTGEANPYRQERATALAAAKEARR